MRTAVERARRASQRLYFFVGYCFLCGGERRPTRERRFKNIRPSARTFGFRRCNQRHRAFWPLNTALTGDTLN